MSDAATATVFGVSRMLENAATGALCAYLGALFVAQHGRAPAKLDDDLEKIGKLFRTGVSPKVVRQAVVNLPATGVSSPPQASDVIALEIDSKRALITPEGRVLLEVLQSKLNDHQATISESELAWALSTVASLYRGWQREWIRRHVSGGDLRPKSLAVVLMLLVNRSIGRDHALRTPRDRNEQGRLADAISRIVNAFLEVLGASGVSAAEAGRITSNWMYTEATRQLPGLVTKDKGEVWIEPSQERILVLRLAEILAGRKKPYPAETLEGAVKALTDTYHRQRPAFSALGLAHERPHLTQERLEGLMEAYREALSVTPAS